MAVARREAGLVDYELSTQGMQPGASPQALKSGSGLSFSAAAPTPNPDLTTDTLEQFKPLAACPSPVV